ncbi:MAG: hypothetical protein WCG10_06330 [Chlamydiota bacterium]
MPHASLLFFCVATGVSLLSTTSFGLPLLGFAPYLSFIFLKHPLKHLLWKSFLCGLMMDFLQSSLPFGYCSLSYVLTSLILYRQKWLFFHDKLISLAIFSSFFSLIHSVSQILLFDLTKKTLAFSWKHLLSELVMMPLCDGLYAFIGFTMPSLIYTYIKKHGFRWRFIKN